MVKTPAQAYDETRKLLRCSRPADLDSSAEWTDIKEQLHASITVNQSGKNERACKEPIPNHTRPFWSRYKGCVSDEFWKHLTWLSHISNRLICRDLINWPEMNRKYSEEWLPSKRICEYGYTSNLHTIQIIILEIGSCKGQSLAALLSNEFDRPGWLASTAKAWTMAKNRVETWATHSDRCYKTNMPAKSPPNSINPDHL